jgi:hypothetical protein
MFDFKRVLGFIWAAPVTVVGLAYTLLFAAAGWYSSLGRHADALVWQLNADEAPPWLNKAWSRWGGHCLGNVVVLKYSPDTDRGRVTLRHEQEHVHQCMTLGIFQPILYGLAYLGLMCSRHAHPYYDNPFEIDARRAAGQVVDVVGAVKRAYATGKLKLPVQKQ